MLEYGDDYITIDNGDIFAGSWDMLEDCFGIDKDTIDNWTEFHKYTYTVKKYTAEDEFIDSVYRLRGKLNSTVVQHPQFVVNELNNMLHTLEASYQK